MRKFTLAVLAATALVLPLAACEDTDESTATVGALNAPVPTTTTTATTVKTTTPDRVSPGDDNTVNDQAYIAALDDEGISYPSEQNAIQVGHLVCESFDEGNDFVAIAMELYTSSQMDAYQSGYVVGAAVAAFCPEYLDQIQ